MPLRKRQLNPAEDWRFPHLFCSIMETWKHVEMVPGRQHDEITSQPPSPPPVGIRARWQTKLLGESHVNRANLKADNVIIVAPLRRYQHSPRNGKFTPTI